MNTLDQEFQEYKGQSVLAPGGGAGNEGQCEQWFDFVLHDVYGKPYFYSPAAKDIYFSPGELQNSFDLIPYSSDMQINKGDVVVYGPKVGSEYGHVSIAAQDGVGSNYIGYDSNWGDSKILEQVTHNDQFNSAILGILRIKGGSTVTPEQVAMIEDLKQHLLKIEAQVEDVKQHVLVLENK